MHYKILSHIIDENAFRIMRINVGKPLVGLLIGIVDLKFYCPGDPQI